MSLGKTSGNLQLRSVAELVSVVHLDQPSRPYDLILVKALRL